MSRSYRRTPKGYDGTKVTSHQISELLPSVLSHIDEIYHQQSDKILSAWPEMIGPKLIAMTQAISFIDGVLTVKVKNSTLHSLLSQNDKSRILGMLRQRFPKVPIKTIVFRIG